VLQEEEAEAAELPVGVQIKPDVLLDLFFEVAGKLAIELVRLQLRQELGCQPTELFVTGRALN
jgi:hypothetical protein